MFTASCAYQHPRTTRVLPTNERTQFLWNADPFDATGLPEVLASMLMRAAFPEAIGDHELTHVCYTIALLMLQLYLRFY